MQQFKENIAALPTVDDIQALELFEGEAIEPLARIENIPGKSASLKIYYYLGGEYGGISPRAAEKGLDLYAEYVEEAKQVPGSHPNIDLLLDVIANQRFLAVKAIKY